MRLRRTVSTLAVIAALLAGCSSDESDTSSDGATSTTAAGPADDAVTTTTAAASDDVLRVLVTNDDGVGAPGLDVLVNALAGAAGIEFEIVAPAENQSGTGDQTTAGELEVDEAAATASGVDAVSVRGYPADSVVWALADGNLSFAPHLVVSGINFGQNIGNLAGISGTVGAAKTAARAGIPSLAVSQGAYGPVTEPDFASGAVYALQWIEEHRAALLAGEMEAEVTSINVPTCVAGSIKGVVEVPTAPDLGERQPFEVNCETTLTAPADDVDALLNGYVSVSVIEAA